MFRAAPLSIIRSFSLYTQQWYMSYYTFNIQLHCTFFDVQVTVHHDKFL